MKLPSAEIPELLKVILFFKPGVGQNIALHVLSTAGNSAFLIYTFFFFFFFKDSFFPSPDRFQP